MSSLPILTLIQNKLLWGTSITMRQVWELWKAIINSNAIMGRSKCIVMWLNCMCPTIFQMTKLCDISIFKDATHDIWWHFDEIQNFLNEQTFFLGYVGRLGMRNDKLFSAIKKKRFIFIQNPRDGKEKFYFKFLLNFFTLLCL